MAKGKLIVLEGIDGSGKSAHYRRICEKLKRDGIAYDHIVFPRYDKESSALIRMYLSGQFGSHPNDVNAYTASTFFAVDRFASYRRQTPSTRAASSQTTNWTASFPGCPILNTKKWACRSPIS